MCKKLGTGNKHFYKKLMLWMQFKLNKKIKEYKSKTEAKPSYNKAVTASPPFGGSGSEKTQSSD